MKKLLAVILTVMMTISVFVFTANAADNEWEVYASVGAYKEEYEDEGDMPHEPGFKYTDLGVTMYSATTEQLEAMNKNAWGGLQLKEKVNLSDGFKMTALIEKYTDKSDDKWISFCIWTDPKATPANTEHGTGWFSLCRPSGANVTLQSFIDNPMNIKAQPNIPLDIYNGEALVLEVRKVDGKLKIFINDQDMMADSVFSKFENNEAYVSIVAHAANRDEFSITITDVNDVKPTGTDAKEPFLESDAKPREIGPEVPENEPCWLWDANNVKKNNPGAGMSSIQNDDGSLHISFTNDNASQFNPSVKPLYDAETFPVFAVKVKGIDDIVDASSLWYCAGEVYGAKEGCTAPIYWSDIEYPTEGGWGILCIDLLGENEWEGYINGFRLDVTGNMDFEEDDTFDLDWMGFFRSEKEAYYYAGMGEYWEAEYGPKDTPTTEAKVTDPASQDTNAPDTNAQPGEVVDPGKTETDNKGTEEVKEPTDTGKKEEKKGNNNTLVIIIVIVVAVVAAAVVCGILFGKKKKADKK